MTQSPDDLLKEVAELPDENRSLLSHNERELIGFCRRLAQCILNLQLEINVDAAVTKERIARIEFLEQRLLDRLAELEELFGKSLDAPR